MSRDVCKAWALAAGWRSSARRARAYTSCGWRESGEDAGLRRVGLKKKLKKCGFPVGAGANAGYIPAA
jgi:hypothetical protein